jgi:hypothetical protein
VSSRLAITQNFEAPLAEPGPAPSSVPTASAFAQLIQQLTSESPAPVPAAMPGSKMWGQGFGPAAGLPAGPELHASSGSAGDLVAGGPVTATASQPETNQSPEPTPDEAVPAPSMKVPLPEEQHMPPAAPRHQQKSTLAKTAEDPKPVPTVFVAPMSVTPPINLKLPSMAARPATNSSVEHTEDTPHMETSPRRAVRTEQAETVELQPPAALEVIVHDKDLGEKPQPAPTPVEAVPTPQAVPMEKGEPAPPKTAAPQSEPAPQVTHSTAAQPAPPTPESIPAPARPPIAQSHPVIVAPTPQAPSAQAHPAPKSAPPPSPVSHLEELAPDDPKQQAQPLRSLSLEFTPDGAQDVRLRLAERAGDVHISLHSTDPALSGRLSDGVHDLVGNLSSAGYDAQAWTPQQGREDNQRQFEDQRKGRRNSSPEQEAEEFGGLMQQPVQEVS